jgi:thioredoxin reductase (NADPH)
VLTLDIECAIIGGGPAGLTAALYLARFRRTVIVVDGRQSRAELIPLIHNYPGFPQGVSGRELLARLREQAVHYSVPIMHGVVKTLKPEGAGFILQTEEHRIRAMTVLLATGVNDRKPPIAGIREATLAGAVRWCPICDGFEVQHKTVALLSPAREGYNHALFLRTYTADLTWFVQGEAALDPAQMLSNLNIRVIEEPFSLIEALPGTTVRLTTKTGVARTFDTIYPMIGCEPRVELLQDLQPRQDSFKQLWVDAHQQTSIPGIYATGDVVHALNQMTVGAAHAATAATAIHNSLPKNYWDHSRESYQPKQLPSPPASIT